MKAKPALLALAIIFLAQPLFGGTAAARGTCDWGRSCWSNDWGPQHHGSRWFNRGPAHHWSRWDRGPRHAHGWRPRHERPWVGRRPPTQGGHWR